MQPSAQPRSSRGTKIQPKNRFVATHREADPDVVQLTEAPEEEPSPRTQFIPDASASIITFNDSPDIPFDASLNPYRGCEHGCVYCYARTFHDYLGFSSGLDFETKIMVKKDAPELLREKLASPKWKPQPLALSGVTDPYQPIERKLEITRHCLAVLAEFRNPVTIVTKNHLVVRDLDYLKRLAAHRAVRVCLSITSLDVGLVRRLEPRSSLPSRRLAAIEALAQAGVPVGVLVAPVIPALTDYEMPAILTAAEAAGARWAGMEIVRLPHAVAALFEDWLDRNAPLKKEKVLARIRSMRGGKLNDPRFALRMSGQGRNAEQIAQMFKVVCRRAKMATDAPALSTAAFRKPPDGGQLELF